MATTDIDSAPTDGPPGGARSADGDDLADLHVALRRTELRLAGLRHQMDLRLQRIRELTADGDQARAERDEARAERNQARAERDQLHVELAALMGTRTFRYSRLPRRLYGSLRARLGSRRQP